MPDLRDEIKTALQDINSKPLRKSALTLLDILGYRSDRTLDLGSSTPSAFLGFLQDNSKDTNFDIAKALFSDWKSADLLFQLTDDEIVGQMSSIKDVSSSQLRSYLFFAIELKGSDYARGKLSAIARQINRVFPMPVMVLLKHGEKLSIAVINRRQNKVQADKDVLEKVTLIRDISLASPHRGHLDILQSFALSELEHPKKLPIRDFDTLHAAWEQIFNVELLNNRFYKELSNWYFWALPQVDFPDDLEKDDEKRRATGLIRLLTRLIFCWFLKEKDDLIPEKLFHPADLAKLLKGFDAESETSSTYYLAILQNLFFATLNQRMGKDGKGNPYRVFATDEGFQKNRATYDVNNLYRYENLFAVPQEEAIALFADIPFLNGGLFECLDRTEDGTNKKLYLDGFSRRKEKRPHVPDRLFFDSGETADLSEVYGDKKRKAEKVTGLISILNRYKFTIVENTPIDQEIALDPELLGKVFENLLASYNEETKTTARKQTGSFYTPRPIVDYMVDESLKAHLSRCLMEKAGMNEDDAKAGLDLLFTYTEKDHPFTDSEVAALIIAIDEVKILDPACGSGAFPMGVLHKLVYILGKLDPDNERWKQTQLAKLDSAPMREALEAAFEDNNDDYGRKLYLIENCLYGVDIQPIAIQITKLRFFISLVCDQKTNRNKKDNHGIRPLPNLETKFVAADTLIGLPISDKDLFIESLIAPIEKEIEDAYHGHFTIQRRDQKLALQKKIKALRHKLADTLAGSLGAVNSAKAKHLAEWDPFDPQSTADFFDPHWMFGRSLKDGFDLVIGNPPYIQLQKFPADQKAKWEAQKFATYAAMGDLYCLFYERGTKFLRPEGHLCYITSNKWMRAGYGEKLRDFFTTKTQPKILIDFAGQKIFEAATVDTNILLFERKEGGLVNPTLSCIATEDCRDNMSVFVRQHATPCRFNTSASWVILSPIERSIKEKIERVGTPLKDWDISINYGIKTGFNEAFIIDKNKRAEILANCKNDDERKRTDELIRPILRGRDIKRYGYEWARLYIIAAHNGIPRKNICRIDIEKYPAIKRHLDSFWPQIEKRSDQGDTPYHLRSCAYWEDFSKPKIVWAETMRIRRENSERFPRFSYSQESIFTDKTCFMAVGNDLKWILAFLNSTVGRYQFSQTVSMMDNGGYLMQKIYVEQIRIGKATQKNKAHLISLVEELLNPKTIIENERVETEIDTLVFDAFGISLSEQSFLREALTASLERG